MNNLFLFDIPPDPVSTVGLGMVIVLAIVILAIVAVTIGAFVFLLIWRKRRNASVPLGTAVNAQQS